MRTNNSILRSKYPYRSTNIYNITASRTVGFSSLNPFEKMERARKMIFVFDYPTPENIEPEDFKAFFEKMFIGKYLDEYFKYETFERWHIAFYSKMLEVLPYYNTKLSIFFEDKKELFGTITETETESENENTGNTNNKTVAALFPSNLVRAGSNIENINYANNGTVNNTENSDNAKGKSKSKTVTNNKLENAIKFDSVFNKIFTDLLNEFAPLFSAVICY